MPAGDADVPPRLKPELRMNWASMRGFTRLLRVLRVNHFVTSTVRPPSRPLEFLDAGILDEGCGRRKSVLHRLCRVVACEFTRTVLVALRVYRPAEAEDPLRRNHQSE